MGPAHHPGGDTSRAGGLRGRRQKGRREIIEVLAIELPRAIRSGDREGKGGAIGTRDSIRGGDMTRPDQVGAGALDSSDGEAREISR